MKVFVYLIFFVATFNFCYSQELHLKKYSGESVIIELNEIDSMMFQRNIMPQDISSPDTVNFNDLNCERYYVDTTISIINSGDKPLLITHVDLSPIADFRFVTEPPTIMSIEPHKKYDFNIRFEPTEVSEMNKAVLTITSNAQSGVYHKIFLQGKKDSLNYSLSETDWNLGDVCYNSSIDTSISVTNTGEGTIEIMVSTPDAINNPNQKIILGPGEIKNVNFVINTGFVPGDKIFTVICTDNCGNEKSLVAVFNVIKPNYSVDTTKFTAKQEESCIKTVVFHNNTNDEVIIDSIEINDEQFELLTNNLPLIVPAFNIINLDVKYTPVTNNAVHAKITFSGQPCKFNVTGILEGDPVNKIFLLNEDFENYSVKEFPEEGGWIYSLGIDSLGYVVDSIAKNGNKSFYIEGVSEPEIISYYVKHRLNNSPDKIFVESWIMIENGHAGAGIFIGSSEMSSCYSSLQYGNHGHYFSTFGSNTGIWPEKGEYYGYLLQVWNKLSFEFDRKNKTQKVYINDNLVYEDTCPTCSFGEIESVFLYASQTGAYIDDIKVWYYEEK